MWSQQLHWTVAVLFVVIRNICCYALDCGQMHGKTNKRKQMLHCNFNFLKVSYKLGIWTNCHGVPAIHVHCFSRCRISLFRNSVKIVPRATLWNQHLRTVQHKSSQQFRLTPRTEQQCVPFCAYSQVQAQYRLNIAPQFNPQPHTLYCNKTQTHDPASYPACWHCNIDRTYLYQLNSYNYKTL